MGTTCSTKAKFSCSRSQSAFTLVEILLVIAIVSIVASILLPAVLWSRDKARQSVCASNLRQIGIASTQYAADNNSMMFPAKPHADDTGGIIRWSGYEKQHKVDAGKGRLGQYISNADVWFCPSALQKRRKLGPTETNFTTYGLNITLARAEPPGGQPVAISRVQSPSETILAADSAANDFAGLNYSDYVGFPSDHDSTVYGVHMGRANVLWFDGHVSARKPVATSPLGAGTALEDLQRDNLGDILRGPMTGNNAVDDYYYELDKPQV